MDNLINAFLAIGLLVVIILIVYLVDRVNSIERETRRVAQSVSTPVAPVKQGPFGDLEGKRLWDALSGRAPDGMDEPTLQDMRERYELVLHKHIQSVFDEGVRDGRARKTADQRMRRRGRDPVPPGQQVPHDAADEAGEDQHHAQHLSFFVTDGRR